MGTLRQPLRRIPYWAYLMVFLVIATKTLSIINFSWIPMTGETGRFEGGWYIIYHILPDSPAAQVGIRTGDTIVSVNSSPLSEWFSEYHGTRAGDTLTIGLLRNAKVADIPVITTSEVSLAPGFFWSFYSMMILASLASLYILYLKPNDRSVKIFFFYIQLVIILSTGEYNTLAHPMVNIASIIFKFSSCFIGPVIIHFHCIFPKPLDLIRRFKAFPWIFYLIGGVVFLFYSAVHFYVPDPGGSLKKVLGRMDLVALQWVTLTFIIALAVVIYQFITIRNTLARKQLFIILTGSFFGFITPIVMSFLFNYLDQVWIRYPLLIPIAQGTGTMIMICCILIALFRFRIWDMEFFIRRVLLYLGATVVIIASYLFLIWLVDQFFTHETDLIRFAILAVSIILFLILRDRLQRLIDRIFHRETYDSASVVSDFESKLAGVYRVEELKQKIVQCLDEIFHFKSFVFNLRKHDLIYETVCILGGDNPVMHSEFGINPEFEEKIRGSKVFSPEELSQKLPLLETFQGDLIIPLVSDQQPDGFFICGKKKSERNYSRQDINVLTLLARRVIALLHTANLYQKDLDRQLMLERERARISQDMHDDVGASLTRISMMSDLLKSRKDIGEDAGEWLGKISETSRGLTEEMNQIIWALNPKNDSIESLVTHIRRYALEYLEPTSINCIFDLPDDLPDLALTVEVRRNIYLVVREALHNVVKHARATKLSITLEMNVNGFIIRIKDDGIGFDPGKLEIHGNGLVNMKKRMAEIGGKFELESTADHGMTVILGIP